MTTMIETIAYRIMNTAKMASMKVLLEGHVFRVFDEENLVVKGNLYDNYVTIYSYNADYTIELIKKLDMGYFTFVVECYHDGFNKNIYPLRISYRSNSASDTAFQITWDDLHDIYHSIVSYNKDDITDVAQNAIAIYAPNILHKKLIRDYPNIKILRDNECDVTTTSDGTITESLFDFRARVKSLID